ncbi:MAG: MarR family transcriptional regulator [Betaproteobacteria bacterium]|nr:MarR family transcriptional regulator [Betaproteobacteria bacterium]
MHKSLQTRTTGALPDQCARSLLDALPLVMDFVRTHMRESRASLSIAQFRALLFLRRHSGASLADLARHQGVAMATASVMVERLVRSGWVQRVPAPEERRRICLSLSETGAGLVDQARTAAHARLADRLSSLSAEEIDRVIEGVVLLTRVFAKENPINRRA